MLPITETYDYTVIYNAVNWLKNAILIATIAHSIQVDRYSNAFLSVYILIDNV